MKADERLERLMKKARRLPLTPGVYLMRDKSGRILYVGKAKALRNRVSQYFGTQERHTEKVRRMVEHVEDFEVILCNSEFEALMLECSLIKQHDPKYNILLKDGKGFHYIRVSKPPWRTVSAAKQMLDDGADYIGPFYSGYNVTQSVDAARKAFKLPSCSKSGDMMGRHRGRPCLNFHIGLCSGPCCGKISREAYEESVDAALRFLSDGSSAAIAALTEQMEQAAADLAFEKAARLRDAIRALGEMTARQKVVETKIPEQDVVALAQSPDAACFEVFNFRQGKLCDREHFLLDPIDNADEARSEFLRRYYSLDRTVPPVVALDGGLPDEALLTEWLTAKRGKKVSLTQPQRGEQRRLIEMCRQNAAEFLGEKRSRPGRETAALDELTRLLGLPKPPAVIEAYDISHTAGEETVGGMVVYRNGAPDRRHYRKFKVRDYANDDPAAMTEVLTRRVAEHRKGEDEAFACLPDLILLDGGRGQVAAVKAALAGQEFPVPIFGMVKDSRHKTRAVTSEGEEIAVKATRSAYSLVYAIQEEVHRYAIGYHRQRRRQKMLGSSLTEIPGVGETRAKALMAHFGTVAAIKNAMPDDLARVKGIPEPVAAAIYTHFHP